jgi:hypothetical protein
MVIQVIHSVVVMCALFGSILSLRAAQQAQVKKVPVTSANSPSGVELYKGHCAVGDIEVSPE